MAPTIKFTDALNCRIMECIVFSFDLLLTGMYLKYTQIEKNDLEICFWCIFFFYSTLFRFNFVDGTKCSCMERIVSCFDLLVTGMHPKYTQSEKNDLEICFWRICWF